MARKRSEPARPSTPAMLARNKIGSLILRDAPAEEIEAARKDLAAAVLETQIKVALSHGVTPGKVAYIAKKLAGAK